MAEATTSRPILRLPVKVRADSAVQQQPAVAQRRINSDTMAEYNPAFLRRQAHMRAERAAAKRAKRLAKLAAKREAMALALAAESAAALAATPVDAAGCAR